MEREKLEKLRRKADKDKADAAKRAAAGKGDKVSSLLIFTTKLIRLRFLSFKCNSFLGGCE